MTGDEPKNEPRADEAENVGERVEAAVDLVPTPPPSSNGMVAFPTAPILSSSPKDRTAHLLQLYGLYFQRLMKEYDNTHSTVKLYLTMNVAVFAVLGYVAKSPADLVGDVALAALTFFVALVGGALSLAWLLVAKDSFKWTVMLHWKMARIESRLLQPNAMYGFSTDTLRDVHGEGYDRLSKEPNSDVDNADKVLKGGPRRHRRDFLDVGTMVPKVFMVVWLLVIGLASLAAMYARPTEREVGATGGMLKDFEPKAVAPGLTGDGDGT